MIISSRLLVAVRHHREAHGDTLLYYPILYSTIIHYTLLYSTILHYTILHYTIIYYTILYYTILYYTILYYNILYYTILYYTNKALSSPRRGAPPPRSTWRSLSSLTPVI